MGSRRGALDVKPEVATRVADAVEAGRAATSPPPGATGAAGSLYVRDRAGVWASRHSFITEEWFANKRAPQAIVEGEGATALGVAGAPPCG